MPNEPVPRKTENRPNHLATRGAEKAIAKLSIRKRLPPEGPSRLQTHEDHEANCVVLSLPLPARKIKQSGPLFVEALAQEPGVRHRRAEPPGGTTVGGWTSAAQHGDLQTGAGEWSGPRPSNLRALEKRNFRNTMSLTLTHTQTWQWSCLRPAAPRVRRAGVASAERAPRQPGFLQLGPWQPGLLQQRPWQPKAARPARRVCWHPL